VPVADAQMFSLFLSSRFRSSSSVLSFIFPFLTTRPYSSSTFIPNNFDDVDNVVSSFNHMFRMNPSPSIIQFNKILGSLGKSNNKHYPTAISLFHQLEFNGIIPDIFTFYSLIVTVTWVK
jgi:hypothetical protein